MSLGLPIRLSSRVVSGPRSCGYDTTRPTMIVLQRMPYGAYSTAMVRVSAFMPPFAALYTEIPGTPNVEPPDDTFTIDPPPASTRCGIAYFDAQKTLPVSVARTI